jgi:hypothetical protein
MLFIIRHILGLFDIHKETNCSTVVTTGIHHALSALWVVNELNRYNLTAGVTIGQYREKLSKYVVVH